MSLSAEYTEPFLTWLKDHAQWSLLIAFFISFAESLAIIGSIVPGSVMMTLVGILAGSGVMRIDLTLLVASLGAIAGDGGSYLLGYYFSNKLYTIWPFRKYPQWLKYGEAYFYRHGGKSIFLGRFIGPLRSIIPVIAGMMRMKRNHFFIANSLSALPWAIVYVGPGILIGSATTELSNEIATELFVFILGSLLSIWLITLCCKWIWKHIHKSLNTASELIWNKLIQNRFCKRQIIYLTPKSEKNHVKTLSILISLCFFSIFSVMLFIFIQNGSCLKSYDLPIYYLFQSFRTQYFDVFFTFLNAFIEPIALLSFAFTTLFITLVQNDWKTSKYLLSLIVSCFIITGFLHLSTEPLVNETMLNVSYSPLMYATRLMDFFAFISFLLLIKKKDTGTFFDTYLYILLVLLGVGLIYLGDFWFSGIIEIYAIGLLLSLSHYLFYRRKEPVHLKHTNSLFIASLLVLHTLAIYLGIHNFQLNGDGRTPSPQQYNVSYQTWWNNQEITLPLYTNNRFGKARDLLNIQYVGSVKILQNTLIQQGWKVESKPPLLKQLASKLHLNSQTPRLPPNKQFYLNQKPQFVMSYLSPDQTLFLLKMWRSNYSLLSKNRPMPIWLGNIETYRGKTMKLLSKNKVMSLFSKFQVHLMTISKAQSLSSINSDFLIKVDGIN